MGSTEIYFANITSYNARAKEYALARTEKVLFFVETHTKEEEQMQEVAKFEHTPWRAIAAAARPSSKSDKGCVAGVLCLVKRHLAATHGAKEGSAEPQPYGMDWLGITVQLKGLRVLIIGMYWTCSTGNVWENEVKRQEVQKYLEYTGLPFVILADFNTEPHLQAVQEWAQRIGGVPVVPIDAEITCSTGGGAMDDYAIVDKRLLPVVSLRVDPTSPWKPHTGIILTLQGHPGVCIRGSSSSAGLSLRTSQRSPGRRPWTLPQVRCRKLARRSSAGPWRSSP